jgi:hypothetical protein
MHSIKLDEKCSRVKDGLVEAYTVFSKVCLSPYSKCDNQLDFIGSKEVDRNQFLEEREGTRDYMLLMF